MPRHRVETHSHTAVVSPCGRLSPDELVHAYCRAGYSALIITDHFVPWLPIFRGAESWPDVVERFYSGFRAAARAARGTGLATLPGFELSFVDLPGRDFLVYGLDEKRLLEVPDPWSMGLGAFRQAVDAAGALIFQAHPYRYSTPVDPHYLHGVEVYNGNPRHESQNELAARFAEDHGVLALSGSDAHQWPDIARGGVLMPDAPGTIDEFVQIYRDRSDEIELLLPSEAVSTARAPTA